MNKYLQKVAQRLKVSEGTYTRKGPTPVDTKDDAKDSVEIPYNESKGKPNRPGDTIN